MKCPICGGAELIHDTRDVPYVYKGEETSIPGVEGDFCPACGEIILDMANAARVNSLAGEFIKQSPGSAPRPAL